MAIREGDIVSRPYGTLNTRADVEYKVVEVSKKQIKIVTDAGNNQWFGLADWVVVHTDWKEITKWGVVYSIRDQNHTDINFFPDKAAGDRWAELARNANFTVHALKKITLPYKIQNGA